jgi:hypothetical protein
MNRFFGGGKMGRVKHISLPFLLQLYGANYIFTNKCEHIFTNPISGLFGPF